MKEQDESTNTEKASLEASESRPAVFIFTCRLEYRFTEDALSKFAKSVALESADSLKALSSGRYDRGESNEQKYQAVESVLAPYMSIELLRDNVTNYEKIFVDFEEDTLIRLSGDDPRLKGVKVNDFGVEEDDEGNRMWIEIEFRVQLEVVSGIKFDGTDGEENPDLEWLGTDMNSFSTFWIEPLSLMEGEGVENLLEDESTCQLSYEVELI